MAICYFDEYARVDGEWFFSRRRERHWYAADVTGTPQSTGIRRLGGQRKACAARRVQFVGAVLGRRCPRRHADHSSGEPGAERSRTVEVGVWFDLRNPPGWRQDPARLAAFTLELCEEAELLGADSLWFSEHHGFEDGYLSQPLTFAAAAAARTTRVRLGTGILVAPLRKTVQLAEEAAVVDLISGGRLELGLGAGYRVPEFELFGTDFTARYRILDQQVSELRRLWGDGGLTPAPAPDRPPIWLGYQGPKGARRAGRMGEGLLTVAKDSWPHYRDGLAEGGHDPATARIAGGIQAYVTDDPERDWPRVAPHIAYAQDGYRRYMVEGTGHPVPHPVDPERLRTRGPDAGPMSYFLFGTPEEVAKAIGEYAGDAPVQTVWLGASVAGLPGTWPSATCRPSAPGSAHSCRPAAEGEMTMGRLEGKIAIITGAAAGIGQATARRVAAEGARTVVADLNADGAKLLAEAIAAAGGEATAVQVDLGDADSVRAMVQAAVTAYGGLDILHNNAAATILAATRDLPVSAADPAVWDETMRVNLRGALVAIQAAAPHMIARGGGSVINTASAPASPGTCVPRPTARPRPR